MNPAPRPPGDAADASAALVRSLRRELAAGGDAIELIETHISWVLLAGDEAWKIKKPVSLGFLDFGSLAQRRHFCAEELRLNRRLAPSVYLGVVPVTGTAQAPRLGGEGEAIEYALRMRRFPPRALLSDLLADGRLLPAHVDALALRMAALHRGAARAPADGDWGTPAAVAGAARALLQRLAALGVDVQDLLPWLAAQEAALAPLWRRRLDSGRVREGHGDLHLANAVLLDEGVTAFDGIEFDPALRWIDVQSDIAFPAMDLMARGRPDLGWRFINAWLAASGDHAGVPVLRFYLVYRALVRTLVETLEGHRGPGADATRPAAGDYLALARRLAFTPPAPRLLVTHGLSGSGKTTLTQGLLEQAGALRLRSDVERKRLFGLPPLQPCPPAGAAGLYGAAATRRTYTRLLRLAQLLLCAGWPVIVDAACLRRAERTRLAALAAHLGLPFHLLDCQAPAAVLRERVRARRLRRDDASDADEAVLARQFDLDEPLDADEGRRALLVPTDRPLDLQALAARWLAG